MKYSTHCAMPKESLRKNNIAQAKFGIINDAAQTLSRGGVANARHNAEELLAFASGMERSFLYIYDSEIEKGQIERFLAFVRERLNGRPLQYILGEAEFYGLKFKVEEGVFIPRPETELLVGRVMAHRGMRIADLGTGCGNIAIGLTNSADNCRMFASDISGKALKTAKINASCNGADGKIQFFCGDLFEPLKGLKFDIIVSNPPYIPSGDIAKLPLDVRQDPKEALDGGNDGLEFYRRIITQAPEYIEPGGFIMLETGDSQSDSVGKILADSGFSQIETAKDYNGIERVIEAQWIN